MAKGDQTRTTASAIKDLILTRGLRPGDPMPTEAELMDELAVSRSSVREAVRTLVALDLLEVRHGTGTFVGQMSLRPLVEAVVFRGVLNPGEGYEALRDVVEVRMGLDYALAPRIVERLDHTEAAELRASVDAMVAAAARNETYPDADRAFHLQLAERLGNRLYSELVGAFWDIHRTMSPRLGVASRRDLTDTAQAHADLLDAALAGDLAGYRNCIQAHYAPLLRALDQAHTAAKAS
nr:FadR family transcriptional regulator [Propionibacterium sp.]